MSPFEERTNRRDALRELFRGAAKGAQEIANPLSGLTGIEFGPKPAPRRVERPPRPELRFVPGGSAERTVPLEAVLEWAEELALGEHADAIAALAAPSLRVVAVQEGGASGSSRLGGEPTLPPGVEWPKRDGERLPFLGQLELPAELGGDGPSGPPSEGLALVFLARPAPSGLEPEDAGSCAVIWSPLRPDRDQQEAQPGGGSGGGRPLGLSEELTLPRAWHSAVRALELGNQESRAWEELRLRLATEQGVELYDRIDGHLLVNRVYGYPDERRGDMPLICELLERGVELRRRPPRSHPESAAAGPAAGRWRLLAQFSRDDELSDWWPDADRRLYLWIDGDRLREGDFSGVRAIVR